MGICRGFGRRKNYNKMGMEDMKKKILFGAGLYGRMAVQEYGRENLAYIVDNKKSLQGSFIDGIEVIGIEELKKIYNKYDIVITTKYKSAIVKQLRENGIESFEYYYNENGRYYPTNELVVNPYEGGENSRYLDDTKEGILQKKAEIDLGVEDCYHHPSLFNHVEIETINRCNGQCEFCPVSVGNDIRELMQMPEDLFMSIIDQLAAINYSGRLALFSNNEPFLDKTIIEKHKYARGKLPHARMHLFTNGTMLTLDRFVEVIKYLDELVIDNYSSNLQLLDNSKEIVDYCEKHIELKSKVTIVLRKPDEILSNRGGDAPNRNEEVSYPDAKCILPFKQLIIRPDGKVSLCCNDPLGKNTLADLTKETIIEAWNNQKFQMVREALHKGRKEWKHCGNCDVFNLG